VRRVAARHDGCGKPTVTHSLERRRRHPARRSRRRLGPVVLLWAGQQRFAPVDLWGKEDECGGRHREMTTTWRALTGEDGGDSFRPKRSKH
jgi:hypothetical protein